MKRKAADIPQPEFTFVAILPNGKTIDINLIIEDEEVVLENMKLIEQNCKKGQAYYPGESFIKIATRGFVHKYLAYADEPNNPMHIDHMHLYADYIRRNSKYVGIAFCGDLEGDFQTMYLNKDRLEFLKDQLKLINEAISHEA